MNGGAVMHRYLVTRRLIISALISVALAPRLSFATAVSVDSKLIDRFVARFGCSSARDYCSEHPVASCPQELLEEICPLPSERRYLLSLSDGGLSDWLQDRMADDFADGRTASLGRWMVSRSELSMIRLVGASI